MVFDLGEMADRLRAPKDLEGFWQEARLILQSHGVTDFIYFSTFSPRAALAGVISSIDFLHTTHDALRYDERPLEVADDLTAARALGQGLETVWHDEAPFATATQAQIERTYQDRTLGLHVGYTMICTGTKSRFSSLGISLGDEKPTGFDRHWNELSRVLLPAGQLIDALTLGERLPQSVALSPREADCLAWLAAGQRPEEIAGRMQISYSTVDKYIVSAREKLGAQTRDQAVARALALGLIAP